MYIIILGTIIRNCFKKCPTVTDLGLKKKNQVDQLIIFLTDLT